MEYSGDRPKRGGRSGSGQSVAKTTRSVHRENREKYAYLKLNDDRPKLNWNWDDNANPKYGAGSRGECLTAMCPELPGTCV